MTLKIRRATVSDAEIIVEFNRRLAWESEQKRLDADVLTRGIRAVFTDPQKGFYTLAERDGEVVGQTLITYEWSDWRNGWYWWIQSVYVREDARRQGVFRAIFEQIRSEAIADATVIGLRLYVEHGNTRGQATYRDVGLEPEGYELFGQYPLPGRSNAIG